MGGYFSKITASADIADDVVIETDEMRMMLLLISIFGQGQRES
jgi:uncharacterized membrane protein